MTEQQIRQVKLETLGKLLRKHQVDALVLTNNLDQYYLSNFFFYPDEAVFIVYKKNIICFTRDLYLEPLRRQAPYLQVIGTENRLQAALDALQKLPVHRAGFDAAKEAYRSGKQMQAAGLVELPSLISQMRQTKDAAELKRLRASNRIAYLAYEYVRPRIKTGMSEHEVAALIEQFMRSHGASTTSFLTIVCFGENAANPHHETSGRKLKNNEAILMDYGCIYQGYCSDITRSWWHGKKVPQEYQKIWNLVDKARRAGINMLRPGVPTKKVDGAARGLITQAGYGEYFTHRTGHGVGMDIHEEPCNSADSAAVLQAGNVVTVEPGIYLPGKFGVRLEDTLAVTKTGATILTRK